MAEPTKPAGVFLQIVGGLVLLVGFVMLVGGSLFGGGATFAAGAGLLVLGGKPARR